ncbi:PTS system mannose/fructose/N-acetylgalactosamine-transporter subunit IIB [Clostridium nigeriense]|uniref:PTS system mannose/fructose/N-acetylgalactosamine-transporter subunit IIB n=1 Tax=Clostridium nigeriense TaxID=1805470 RepID=UPI0008345F20|nr:PTS sugar transporter subunit IIB [Clostridium nigeriense]
MNITVFRIDDRLIHGQIITAWLAYADAKQIVVADDKAAKDSFQQTLLKMATPDNVQLKIMTLSEAKEAIKNDEDNTKTLFLAKGPKEALEILDSSDEISNINVGNLNMKKGKTKVLGNLWVNNEEVDAFVALKSRGINLEVRAVPTERSQDVIELLKKEKLI